MTSAHSTTRRHLPSRRARLRPLVAVTLVGVIGLLGAAATALSAPVTGSPSGEATADRADVNQRQATAGAPSLELVDQTFAVEADGSFRLRYRLRSIEGDPLQLTTTTTSTTTTTAAADPSIPPDGGVVVPPDGETAPETTVAPPVQLTGEITNYPPLSDPADVAQVVGSDVDPDVFEDLGRAVDGLRVDIRPLTTVGDDGTATITFDIATDVVNSVEDRLKLERPGIHPIRVQLLIGDPDDGIVVATAGTVVQRLPSATDPASPPAIDLAVVAATPEPQPDGNPADAARTSASFDTAIDFAAAFTESVALALPPTLVADAAATPDGASTLAEALRDDELIPSPIVALDVSSAVAADRADVYTRLVIAGEEALIEAVPTTPARRDVWLASVAVSGGGAQLLRDLGVRYMVMPASLYRDTVDDERPPTDLFVRAELPDGGTLPLLVLDPIADQLTADGAAQILARSTPAEWAVRTLGNLLLEQSRDDLLAAADGTSRPADRSRVLSTPDFAPPDVRLLEALATIADTTPAVEFRTASSLTGVTDVATIDGEPMTVSLPATAGPSLTDRLAVIDSTALMMISAASMLPADDPRPVAWTEELESLISTAYSDADVLAATAAMQAEAQVLRSAVVLPEPFTFTLTGRTGTIELRLGNTSDEPLQVDVGLDSSKVTFPAGDQTVTLRPNDETSVIVPVEARSNGTSSIELTVSTPAGETLGDPVPLTARVTTLTGFGQVLTAGFVLVLLTWWFTHWRSRRRAALADTLDDDGDGGNGNGDGNGDGDGDGDGNADDADACGDQADPGAAGPEAGDATGDVESETL